ncbi:cupin domain-containing protein [Marinobacterium sediminicola]|uniref:Cupin 2 domain-containing protein n=1 Tax=Marinobacterium sediminicola TaxID=518898 RepID=A0ABY1S483_9GAMM|nr:cupin domain-containing protein [Marinobacterium sediminicola]ULG68955.1 cupin domain-containing protein [Marinobacterium sediminicola]SMR78457.1 cupin 2 domain-containing protein [Marinobacterium sediminicola]
MTNLHDDIPAELPQEVFTDLLNAGTVRIERILSHGQTSPDSGWYDQDEHEWVLVLQGGGELTFDNGDSIRLGPGDYLNIPAHTRHRVSWTDSELTTIWLAVFYR